MLNDKLNKLLRDPNRFFEDYFSKRGKRKRSLEEGKVQHFASAQSDRMGGQQAFHEVVKKLVPKPSERTILYSSFNGRSMSCNPNALFRYMLDDPRFSKFEHIWILKNPNDFPEYRKHRRVKLVRQGGVRHRYYLRYAKYLITNNTFPPSYVKRAGQILINTQHGIPIKTMGKDIKNEFGVGANVTRNFLQTDYLVMPNRYTTEAMLRAHDVESLYRGKVLETGQPRSDLTTGAHDVTMMIRSRLQIPAGKKVILYAPTYRGSFKAAVDQSDIASNFIEALQDRYGDDYFIIFKSHHVDEALNADVCLDTLNIDTNELLNIVDILISDYSSIVFDFFRLRRPIIYFAYDLAEYEHSRGTYLDIRELPGSVCMQQEDVFDELDHIDGFMARYVAEYDTSIRKYCEQEDGQCCRRIVETVFLQMDSVKSDFMAASKKTRILVYGGGFLNNGVTSSVTCLIQDLVRSGHEVYVALNRDAGAENIARYRSRVSESVKVIFYIKSASVFFTNVYQHAGHEARRLFGDAQFDIAIDASGYGRLWPGIIAQVHAKKRYIFLHSCMKSESETRPHLADYNYLFELYKRDYDLLINVSQSSYEANSAFLPHLKHKMTILENMIDDKRITMLAKTVEIDESRTNFVNVGRYDYTKGLDRLISAFAQIHVEHPDVRLYLIGYGKERSALEQLAGELGVADKVFLTGKQENPFRLLAKCDCFVMSSRYEGQGIVLLEALVLKVPCISTDISGPRSILEPEFLYDDSIEGLVQGMSDFMVGKIGLQVFDANSYNAKSRAKLKELIE